MKADIYQKLERDYADKLNEALSIIENLDAKTKGMLSDYQLRAIIFEARGQIGVLKDLADSSKFDFIIEKYPKIDFTQPFDRDFEYDE